MTTNRIGGPSPSDPTPKQDTKAQRDEKKRVQKTSAIDPDEQAKKKNKFQAMMDQSDEFGVKPTPRTSQFKSPSPADPKFYQTKTDSTSTPGVDPQFYQSQADGSKIPGLQSGAVTSPGSSPPPNVNAAPNEPDLDGNDLPQSSTFWNDVDLPNPPMEKPAQAAQNTSTDPDTDNLLLGDTPLTNPHMGKKGTQEESFGANLEKRKGREESSTWSPFSPPSDAKKTKDKTPASNFSNPFEKPNSTKSTPTDKPADGFIKNINTDPLSKESSPIAHYWDDEDQLTLPAVSFTKQKGKEVVTKDDLLPLVPPQDNNRAPQTREGPFSLEKQKDQEKEGRQDKKDDRTQISIVAPSATPLPSNIHTQAIAATSFVSPYLSPEALPLFYQMVGSIMVMTTPNGVNKTEVVLNGAKFASSRFFGATIQITKYSTAPDSLNIRLTGSNEAVKAFNENIPSLMEAFARGNFNFRIGRLDTSYSSEKPLFARKESKERGGKQ